ncbi:MULTISPECIES: YgiQ family radical SAM protein [unclassified Mesorhizobium]|uniref:YgiQ family radical SAM protein n=2 Tax=Mesorhizobium TaxID=68287 RepID=UPI000F755AE0|nr:MULTISPECIES: YgiQ family radical SAM protein [unclassified Mesorhizobium]AZO02804.1 YgiQ family radical SAM protein [Mesorhizobium sp. M2A.F.Ca.ET.043.02.1.1]RUW75191.1 YgiQ family radical SAM protein [Mesorhizobium sp. M2A.F.Ca.ET.067.02.1.1]RVC97660.1 YgiQ family radical SAM protein [Mesorhizobium sp. M2A.F.Ca.ET.017.03.2.1]RVD11714.1 YgiQ family radical SAM protein [Mesorhizobium sp. M2A.F.Ca.ET.029.05.1.1]RWB43359.1 MAG: YgiQ family radical SAM protein [Mesorhizobium sp.]
METIASAQKNIVPLSGSKPHAGKAAPFLPMSRAEMAALGWDECDIVLVTGDAYVDHPSFGMAIIGRLLESQGFRVGIISQPDWQSAEPFKALGRPRLFFGVTGGNLDSMVNRYTSDRKLRHDDAYTAGGEGGKRPDRCTIVYTQRCREAYKDVPIVLGGIEASLRRIAHYDYWSDKVRRSILADAKADLLIYGNAERAVVEVANRLAAGDTPRQLDAIRGVALFRRVLGHFTELHADDLDSADEGASRKPGDIVIRLPSFEQVEGDRDAYARASRVLHREANPGNARPLVQRHGDRDLWLNPPPIPLTSEEMDAVYDLPYARAPHPSYGDAKIPAWDMIKFSVTVMRGCFGGCTFCSITEHEGRIIQNRSEGSILREIEKIRDKTPGFTGVISDIGGPTANMYRMACKDPKIEAACRLPSCVFPDICPNLNTSHDDLIRLYRKVREVKGVKKVMVASGVRYDLAVKSPEYVKELVTHHVGGYLKIAPEHTERGPLDKMMKPGIGTYDRFKEMFDAAAKEAGKKYYLIPYFIAAHPGTTDEDMLQLALWLKKNRYRADQVQTFLPSPMATATAMYHTGVNTLKGVRRGATDKVETVRGGRQRRLHKAFLRYHDPDNWPLLRDALKEMGRADLIGPRPDQLVPAHQPPGTGKAAATKRPVRSIGRGQRFTTKGVPFPKK